uniref:Ti plasmid pTi15955 T-DNA region n=1 Tax=Agrobacterium tumefaciens TaxID=358 RepID=Q44392_AGRTU|nr:unnamed protein product [Agrobacterium tumefaciens]prf//1404378A plasmid RL300 DNA [Rhizobium leguminosarum]
MKHQRHSAILPKYAGSRESTCETGWLRQRSACGAVEHSCWDFKRSSRGRTGKVAPENMRSFGERLMDVNKSPGPRMPRIQKLAKLGPVGVLSSRCTTKSIPIPRSRWLPLGSSSGLNQSSRLVR